MITDLKKVSKIVNDFREDGKKVVLATGTFDLFHYEHLIYLKGAKEQGDVLVVAIKDNLSAGLKGNGRPIIDEQHRIAIVDAIKYVDYTFLIDYDDYKTLEIPADNTKQHEWLIMIRKIFDEFTPDILYYENNPKLQTARDRILEKYGIKGVMKPRGESASTTEIIKKIANL